LSYIYKVSSNIVSTFFEIPFLKEHKLSSRETVNITAKMDQNLDCSNFLYSNQNKYTCNYRISKIYIKDIAYFQIKNRGKEIRIKVLEKNYIHKNLFYSKFLNHIIPYALYMNGKLVLHASGITNKNASFLFLGRSQSGKSSLSASLRDYNFLSEDSVLVNFKKNNLYSCGSFPYVKLNKNIALKLFFDIEDSIIVNGETFNRSLFKVNNYDDKIKKIHKCYILKWSNNFKISKLSPKESLVELYASSFGPNPIDSCKESQIYQFKQFMEFIKKIPIYLLERNKKNLFNDNNKIIEHLNF